MNILDRIALNRLIKIITNFILAILKIFAPKDTIDNIVPSPPETKRRKFPWIRKKIDELTKEEQ